MFETSHTKNSGTVHLFPAFVPEYSGFETQVIESYGVDLRTYLTKASEATGEDLTDYNIISNNFLDNQLRSQYIAYIISCCASDILNDKKLRPDYVASYSMGIYAAMYHSGSVDFITGLNMIKTAFNLIEKNLPEKAMSMCAIGGLSLDDINELLLPYPSDVFNINRNSEFSFLLSGRREHLEHIMNRAISIGAMQTRMLPVAHPYHSPLLKAASLEFNNALLHMKIGENTLKYVSSINQIIVQERKDIIAELTNNIYQHFDWYSTFTFFLNNGMRTFIECGAGDSLYRMGKFIEGDFSIYNLKNLKKYAKQ
ncbi:MAG TPA: hypothetical protein PKW80_00540 [Bacteroidales bacterium]|nr:hypothetical protein [Bacteroidales bacterium]